MRADKLSRDAGVNQMNPDGGYYVPLFNSPATGTNVADPAQDYNEAQAALENLIGKMRIVPRKTGELYEKLMPKGVYIPKVNGNNFFLHGAFIGGFRDEYCKSPKGMEDIRENIGNLNDEDAKKEETSWDKVIKQANYARQYLTESPSIICDRGAGSTMGFERPKDKGVVLTKSTWGVLTTDTPAFTRFIMTAARSNNYYGPILVDAMLNREKNSVEEGEVKFEEWSQDKKDEYWAKSDLCKAGFQLYENTKDGTHALSLIMYNGELTTQEEMCLGAMQMVLPQQEKKETEEAVTEWPWGRQDVDGGKGEAKPLKEMKKQLSDLWMENPQQIWTYTVGYSKSEIEGWKSATKYGVNAVLYGGSAAVAARILLRFEKVRAVLVAATEVVGIKWVWDKLRDKIKGPKGPPDGPAAPGGGSPAAEGGGEKAPAVAHKDASSNGDQFSRVPNLNFRPVPFPVLAPTAAVAAAGAALAAYGTQIAAWGRSLVPVITRVNPGAALAMIFPIDFGYFVEKSKCGVFKEDSNDCSDEAIRARHLRAEKNML